MMNKNKLVLFFVLAVLAFTSTSCVTQKKVRYLQDMPIEGMPLNESLEEAEPSSMSTTRGSC